MSLISGKTMQAGFRPLGPNPVRDTAVSGISAEALESFRGSGKKTGRNPGPSLMAGNFLPSPPYAPLQWII